VPTLLPTVTLVPLCRPAQAATEAFQGRLPDATPYRIDMPDNFNGSVLVGLNYAGSDPAQLRAPRGISETQVSAVRIRSVIRES